MPEEISVKPVDVKADMLLTESQINPAINKISKVLCEKGVAENDALFFATNIIRHLSVDEYDGLVKKFQESKFMKPHMGMTLEDVESVDVTHTHEYALIILNWGEQLVGITTKTKGAKEHPHLINIILDPQVKSLVAYTGYGDSNYGSEKGDASFHNHLFSVDIKEMSKTVPSVFVRTVSFADKAVVDDEKDKSKTAEQNTLPSDKKNVIVDKIVFGDHEFSFSNQREAEALLAKVCQQEDNEELLSDVYLSVEKHYPDSAIFNDSYVAEFAHNFNVLLQDKGKKVDPKAKVRNRGDAIVPASQAKDKKDHFPMNSAAQARNALARVAQYDKAPAWWDGSLKSLQKKVRSAVKKKYPQIKVTNLSEYFSIRFKSQGSAFFINSAATEINSAKDDASIYAKNCSSYDVDLVSFVETDDGPTTLKEFGSFVFYDRRKGIIRGGMDTPIELSERDSDGYVIIEIMRTGRYNHPQYGQFSFTDDDVAKVINNYNKRVLGRDISFDYDHEPVMPAAAWLKNLSTIRRDFKGNMQTVLRAHAEFTPRGEESIKNKEYRYFSSEYVDNFIDKETNEEYGTTLKGGGLTNRPWIPGLAPIELSDNKEIGIIQKTK